MINGCLWVDMSVFTMLLMVCPFFLFCFAFAWSPKLLLWSWAVQMHVCCKNNTIRNILLQTCVRYIDMWSVVKRISHFSLSSRSSHTLNLMKKCFFWSVDAFLQIPTRRWSCVLKARFQYDTTLSKIGTLSCHFRDLIMSVAPYRLF